jgi:DNA-binding transcriptional ArsR family regulator
MFHHVVEHVQSQLDATYAALADPTRRAILARLQRRPARVTEVAAEFPVSLNAVSKHIRVLERAGLVRREIRGRDHVLSADPRPLREAGSWIEHYQRFWSTRADALAAHVESRSRGRPTSRERR